MRLIQFSSIQFNSTPILVRLQQYSFIPWNRVHLYQLCTNRSCRSNCAEQNRENMHDWRFYALSYDIIPQKYSRYHHRTNTIVSTSSTKLLLTNITIDRASVFGNVIASESNSFSLSQLSVELKYLPTLYIHILHAVHVS